MVDCFDIGIQDVIVALFGIVIIALKIVWSWIYILAFIVALTLYRTIRRKTIGKIAVKGHGVFITGCDTGFGHDLAARLDQLGFTVFAGCLHPDGDGANRLRSRSSKALHIVPLDVRDDESVRAARDYVVKYIPNAGLWAIVNNAGLSVLGDVEWLTVNLYNKVIDVNFYGTVRITRAFLYLVRKTKGRVLVVTSVRGLMSMPGWSAYHASKFALETMADSLRLEMSKFGVKVAKIQPSNFSMVTAIRNEARRKRLRQEFAEMWDEASDDVRSTYTRDYLDQMAEGYEQVTFATSNSAPTTTPVIDAMVDAIMSERPRTSYLVPGGKRWIDPDAIFARYYGYLPTCISDGLLFWWTKCNAFPDLRDKKAQ